MSQHKGPIWLHASLLAMLCLAGMVRTGRAGEILVADRLENSVSRYSESGAFLGTLLIDNVNLNQPSSVTVSPDLTKLYVASTQNNRVVQYDYNYGTGTAINPVIFGDTTEGILFPHQVLFSQSGQKVFVSNLGGSGVSQFDTAGNIIGAPINGLVGFGSVFQYSALAWAPSGQLLVGGFQDFPAALNGAVAATIGAEPTLGVLTDFVGLSPTLNGAAGFLVNGDDLYVASLYAGTVSRYDVHTGAVDNSFLISGLAFPESIIASPDGSGFLVGVLGFTNGTGTISHYDFNGNFLGVFAGAQGTPATGFTEPTGLVHVPEPSSMVLFGLALVSLVWCARRRVAR